MEIRLHRQRFGRGLAWVVAGVAYCGLWAEAWDDLLSLSDPYGLIEFFGLSYEANLPTWLTSVLLAACASLLALIGLEKKRAEDPDRRLWWFLAFAFLYISIDEVATIHEAMGAWFDFGGVLYFGWVVPAAIVVLVMALMYLNFLRRLPRAFARRFLLAGALYVSGALLMELPLGYWTEQYGTDNFGYALIDWVEETLEIAGVSVFLLALLDYLATPAAGLTLTFVRSERARGIET